jgi:O-antigen/teichoic acid export membrane protein
VLFPAFATGFEQDPDRTRRLFAQGVKYIFLAIFPIALLVVAFAQQGLDLWLGKEFADHSTVVLQLLTVGVLINSLAQVPFSLIQSAGRPDLTAKLHLLELPFYLVAVWLMTRAFGIEGTAMVWSARVMVDALILFRMARGVLPQGSIGFRHAELPAGLALLVLAVGMFPKGLIINALFVVLAMLLFLWAGWFLLLDSKERSWVQDLVRRGPSSETGRERSDR